MSVALACCIARETAHNDRISAVDRTGDMTPPDEESHLPKMTSNLLRPLSRLAGVRRAPVFRDPVRSLARPLAALPASHSA